MGGHVTVACKIPNGLILRVYDMVEEIETVPAGYRTVQKARMRPGEVVIAGPAHEVDKAPKAPISGGYALTYGVDQGFFEEWLEQNKDADYVKNHLIFAATKPDVARDKAQEMHEVKSGLEPLDPDKPPSVKINPNLSKIERADRKALGG